MGQGDFRDGLPGTAARYVTTKLIATMPGATINLQVT
jgi:hypothetical protein